MPRLAVAAWALAAVVIVALAVAVGAHLSSTTASMHMHAFTRAGGDPFGPLLGSNLLTKWQLDSVAIAVAAAPYRVVLPRAAGDRVRHQRQHRGLRPGAVHRAHGRPPRAGHD